MTKTRSTKSALVSSALSLVLCFSMLLGTTFAWFTDSVKTENNLIQSGNLDMEIYYQNDETSDWTKVDSQTNIFKKDTRWEPGHTEVVKLKIVNEGTLAFKYQLGVYVAAETGALNVNGDPFKLSSYIMFGIADGADDYASGEEAIAALENATPLSTAWNSGTETLAAANDTNDDDEQIVSLVVYMPSTVGNEANYMKGQAAPTINLGLNLLATQDDVEEDSFGPDYDEDAWTDGMEVRSGEDLLSAVEAGQNVKLMEDIELTETLVIPATEVTTYSLRSTPTSIIIDLNGNTISGTGLNAEGKGAAVIINEGNVKLMNGTVIATGYDGGATINNKGTLTLEKINVVGAPISTGTGYPAYCINNSANLTVENGTVVSADRGCLYVGGTGETVINGGSFTNNDISDKRASFTSHVVVIGYGASNKLTINGGSFNHLHTKTSGGVVINNWSAVTVDINGGNFSGGNYFGKWDNLSDYGYGSTKTPFAVKGGTFTGMDDKFLAEGTLKVNNADGTITVFTNAANSTMTMADDAVLDLKGVEFLGTVVAEGDLTIKGDTKIKTLTATNGGTITIEDGKTLTLNNFSFGNKSTAESEYTIKGGTVTANYGFFQHGTYALYSNFETGYMYYSFGSDITVYGTFHSQGKGGDNLDYVRGKLTIANGGKTIHDSALWVGQPASWGAMSASLTVEAGGYVQANSLSIYDGSVAYNSAANLGKENVGVKYNSLSGKVDIICANAAEVETAVKAGNTEVYLAPGEYNLYGCGGKTLTINGTKETVILVANEGEAGSDYAFDGSTVTFNGVTFNTNANNGSYKGFARMNGTYYNCTFDGSYALNGNSVFTDCVFNVSGDAYNLWTWGAPEATFNGCTFNSDGKAILLYGGVDTKLTVNNCVFNDNGGLTDLKAAIEIGNDYGRSYELVVNNTTVNGYEINDKGINTGSTLWGNKNSMGTDKLNVVVDGVDVY